MSAVDEILGAKTPMGADLDQGTRALALDQDIEFTLYVRVVLPLDGYVFWVRSDLVAQGTVKPLLTAEQQAYVEEHQSIDGRVFAVKGSLHYSADVLQEEGELWTRDAVVFTALEEVEDLNEIAPGLMWIGTFGGLRFGFSSLSTRYQQAGLWHYHGIAIYPDAYPQIIDRIQDFATDLIVSNSLPAWLAMAGYAPPWAFWRAPPPIYPSMTSPLNARPPFVTVHVLPESTVALASAPTIDRQTSSHTQLCTDTVRLTLWGMTNAAALDFVDMTYRYSLDTARFGVMNIPSVKDEKRGQVELGLVTMKKTVEFQVSYLQQTMRSVAQQVIKTCVPAFAIGG